MDNESSQAALFAGHVPQLVETEVLAGASSLHASLLLIPVPRLDVWAADFGFGIRMLIAAGRFAANL